MVKVPTVLPLKITPRLMLLILPLIIAGLNRNLGSVLMNWWLQNFAYKTEIGVLSFVLGGAAALIIFWITVNYHSIKAAFLNPTMAL